MVKISLALAMGLTALQIVIIGMALPLEGLAVAGFLGLLCILQISDIGSVKFRIVQRTSLIISAVSSFFFTFFSTSETFSAILGIIAIVSLIYLQSTLLSTSGNLGAHSAVFNLSFAVTSFSLLAVLVLPVTKVAFRYISIVLPSIVFGCLIKIENFAMGIQINPLGREAVFDGYRKLKPHLLFKMSAPRFFLILCCIVGFSLGGFLSSRLPVVVVFCLILAVFASSLLCAALRKTLSKPLVLIFSAVLILTGFLVTLVAENLPQIAVAMVFSAIGIGVGGLLGSLGGFYILSCQSLEILTEDRSTALLTATASALAILSVFLGAIPGIWSLLALAFIPLLILRHSKMLSSENDLISYLSSAERNVVVRESLIREMIRRTDAHKRPPRWLYFLAGLVIRRMCKTRYGMQVVKKCRIHGPALILSNHTSNFDYLYIAAACFPTRINFLATYYWFTFKKLRPWLRYMGVIQKYQFATDITAMKKLKYVITQKKGTTFIAPEGTIYANGRSGFMSDSIVKIIKFLKVPVYSVKIEGAGLGHGKWQRVQQKATRVSISVKPLFSEEQVLNMDKHSMYSQIAEALHFDDFEYQARTVLQIPGKDRAEGLDDLIYKCPKCGREFTLKTEGDRIYCTSCGLSATINDSYRFNWPEGKQWFDNYSDWFDWQSEQLLSEMKDNPDFSMSASVIYRIDIVDTDGYVDCGEGTLTLSLKDGWTYTGTLQGRDVVENDSLKSVPVAIMKMGVHIELPFKDGHSRCFKFTKDGRYSQKWHIASRLITEHLLE